MKGNTTNQQSTKDKGQKFIKMLPNKFMLTKTDVLNNNLTRIVQGKAVAMGKKEHRKKTEKLSKSEGPP